MITTVSATSQNSKTGNKSSPTKNSGLPLPLMKEMQALAGEGYNNPLPGTSLPGLRVLPPDTEAKERKRSGSQHPYGAGLGDVGASPPTWGRKVQLDKWVVGTDPPLYDWSAAREFEHEPGTGE